MSKHKSLQADLAYIEMHGEQVQDICHHLAVKAGWWNCPVTGQPSTPEYIQEVQVPRKLLLIHAEISEATEGHRKNLKDSHLPHRDALEVELADALIRIFDLGGALGYNLGAAMAEKMLYNATREDHTLQMRLGENGKRY